jgi:DNA-binding protein YbaB
MDPQEFLEQTLAQLTDLQAKVPQLQKQYENATHETRSKDRRVSAVVGPRGDLRSLNFHGESYRKMSPKELADVIVRTINSAREQAVAEAREQVFQSLDPELRSAIGESGRSESWSVNAMVERMLGATKTGGTA